MRYAEKVLQFLRLATILDVIWAKGALLITMDSPAAMISSSFACEYRHSPAT
jgi:hypothetical protein